MAANRSPLIDMIEVLATEYAALVTNGPGFTIVYGDALERRPEAVLLIHRGRHYDLQLSPALLALFAYLAHQRLAQSLTQIYVGFAREGYSTRRPSHATVKMWLIRLRTQIARALADAALPLDPLTVLASRPTDSNVRTYSLHAVVTIMSPRHGGEVTEVLKTLPAGS